MGALCRNFYIAVDKILGSNFYEKHGDKAGTIDTLAKRMVKVASQINLGLLIIDEIQNIQKAYSGGDDRVINFITELVNTLGIPIIVVGNFKAMYMYDKSLSNTRRGLPDIYLENITSFFTEDSWEWNEFIETLWEQQFTLNYTPLSEEIKKTIYHYTLGIPDIVVKLFMHVQAKTVLNGGEEKISVSLVKEVASRSLALFTPIAEKIRRGSNNELTNLEDVQVDWNSFNEYFKEATYKVSLQGDLKKSILVQHKRKSNTMYFMN